MNEKLAVRNSTLETRVRAIALLGEMSRQIQTCLTVEEAYPLIADYAQLLFPGEAGALYQQTVEQNLMETVASWRGPAEAFGDPAFLAEECWALRRGRLHLFEAAKNKLLCSHLRSASALPAASLCAPLTDQNGAFGLLCLLPLPTAGKGNGAGEAPEVSVAHPDKQQLAHAFAGYIALALSNLKLRGLLREQAIHDPLTRLFNRRYMEETLDRELRRTIRKESPLSILMFEIDNFRRFNDAYGREAGDAYLRGLAHFLQSHIREADIACRYLDDQFALILPETPLGIARQRAEYLQAAVQQLKIEQRGESLEPLTLSFGLAGFPMHGITGEALLRAAEDNIVRPSETPFQLVVGPLSLNGRTFEARIEDKNVLLTPVEFELLYFLMRHPGQVFTTEQLLHEVWRYPLGVGSPELVRVHIKNLRTKIEPDPKQPSFLRTIGRFGYTIRVEKAP